MKVKTIVLVDYENIKPVIDCEQMPKRTCFYILGNKNSTINFEMLRQTQQYPDRIVWVETEGVGRNNLDFHLAYFLGAFHHQYKSDVKLVVLSKDKGYDNLIRFIQGQGRDCFRVTDVNLLKKKKFQVEPEPVKPVVRALIPEVTAVVTQRPVKATAEVNVMNVAVQKVREVLQKGGKPRKLARLKNSINSILHPNPHKIDIDLVVKQLQTESFLKVSGDYVQYEEEELVETIEISAEDVTDERKASPAVNTSVAQEQETSPAVEATGQPAATEEEERTEAPAAEAVTPEKPRTKSTQRRSTRKTTVRAEDTSAKEAPAPQKEPSAATAPARKARGTATEAKPRAAAGRKKKTTAEKPAAQVPDLSAPDTYIREYESGYPPYGEAPEALATNI